MYRWAGHSFFPLSSTIRIINLQYVVVAAVLDVHTSEQLVPDASPSTGEKRSALAVTPGVRPNPKRRREERRS